MPTISMTNYDKALHLQGELEARGIHAWITTGGLAINAPADDEQKKIVQALAVLDDGEYSDEEFTCRQLIQDELRALKGKPRFCTEA